MLKKISVELIQFLRLNAILILQCGIDLRLLKNVALIPRYFYQKTQFIKQGGNISRLKPIISDHKAKAGNANHVYFHQDLLVAQYIYTNNPQRHMDVGSRIDGFVAHIASFRKIDVIDIRPLPSTGHKNIEFLQANLMLSLDPKLLESTDSISCLHAIEHFGLGRYGDPIDPNGHIKGFNNLLDILKPGGTLYISFPVGSKSQVEFNEQRIFNPCEIFSWARSGKKITLSRFDYIAPNGLLQLNMNPINLKNIEGTGCGIYTLTKDK
jgi:hypothetical protein